MTGHTAGPDPAPRPPALSRGGSVQQSGGGSVQRSVTMAQISCHSPPDTLGARGGGGGEDGVNTPERWGPES